MFPHTLPRRRYLARKGRGSVIGTENLNSKHEWFQCVDKTVPWPFARRPSHVSGRTPPASTELHLVAKTELISGKACTILSSKGQHCGLLSIPDMNENRGQVISINGFVDVSV